MNPGQEAKARLDHPTSGCRDGGRCGRTMTRTLGSPEEHVVEPPAALQGLFQRVGGFACAGSSRFLQTEAIGLRGRSWIRPNGSFRRTLWSAQLQGLFEAAGTG